jgi:thiol-disulfide isomerase/thioredoxin
MLEQISARSQDASQYLFEGDMVIQGQKGNAPGRLLSSAKVKFAVSQPGKFLLNVKALEKDEYLLVSDGVKNWAYVPRLKQYTEEEGARIDSEEDEAGGSDNERDLAETFARLIVPTLAKMHKTAKSAGIVGTSEAKIAGKKQKWPVLQVVSRDDARNGQEIVQLTLNPDTLQVGRMVWANVSQSEGERILLRTELEFTSFSIGEPIADSTFAFLPPNKAKLVDAVPIPGQTGSFLLNQDAPDIELKTLDGDKIRFSELRGKPVLINFWASWCGPCRREMPSLVKLHQEFQGRAVFLGINDEGRGAARKFAAEAGLPFPTLDDSGMKANKLYRIRSIPTTFIVDSKGKIVRFLSGGKTEKELREALKSSGL